MSISTKGFRENMCQTRVNVCGSFIDDFAKFLIIFENGNFEFLRKLNFVSTIVLIEAGAI
jgi:hypothetical protein